MKRAYLILFIAILFLQCDREQPAVVEGNPKQIPNQEMWRFSVTATKNGRLEAIVKSGHMVRYEGKNISFLDQNVVVDFFDAQGKHASKLTAQRGELNDKTNDVKAMGHVVVISDSGFTLHSEKLSFDQKRELIVSDVDVMVTTAQGDTLYGKGFESNTDFTRWEIKKPHGIAHTSVDLSADKWKSKATTEDSTKVMADDSLATSEQDSLSQGHLK